MEDKPMCERCEKETLTTIDIWAQGMIHRKVKGGDLIPEGYDAKSFELGGRDYIVLCEQCWDEVIRPTIWAALCKATTIDHNDTLPNQIDILIEGFKAAAEESGATLEQVAQIWAEKFDERMTSELAS